MGCESPYGVVLFADTHYGVAIPHRTRGSDIALQRGLVAARAIIDTADGGADPGEPTRGNPCTGCPHGKPFVHRIGETEHFRDGIKLPVFTSIGVDDRCYHSACGDRFSWTPPHQKADEKELGP